jgi:hypothetical protein
MCDPMALPLCEGVFYPLPERMLKRLPYGKKRLDSRNSCRDFLYAHTNSDTAVSLKIVVGGVRYRAQKRENQIPTVLVCAEQLSKQQKITLRRGCRMASQSSKTHKSSRLLIRGSSSSFLSSIIGLLMISSA